jgi:predicted amidohydrolase YtcJ
LVKTGITSSSDLNVGWIDPLLEIQAYRCAADSGAPIRTTLFPHAPAIGDPDRLPTREEFARAHGLEDPLLNLEARTSASASKLRLGPIKLFSDGALTVRTAALREPYVDGSGMGMLLHEPEELKAFVTSADRQGWQIAIHAIGDRAIELVLDCYLTCSRERRHRIEHAMLMDDALILRFVEQKVVPVVQPEFLSRLGDAYVLGLGYERAARINPTASLQRAGLGVPFSSDCPIVPGAPLDGVRAAAGRSTRSGTILGADERISVMDGLRNYTYWAAYSTFDERNAGQIAAGMRADLAVLNCEMPVSGCDITVEHLGSLEAAATIIGGEFVHGDI